MKICKLQQEVCKGGTIYNGTYEVDKTILVPFNCNLVGCTIIDKTRGNQLFFIMAGHFSLDGCDIKAPQLKIGGHPETLIITNNRICLDEETKYDRYR